MAPDVMLHFGAGITAMLSGATALIARKGERLHRAAGTVFLIAILITAATATYLSYRVGNVGFAIGGVLVIYMIMTAWMAVRRREGHTGLFELGAFLFAAAGSAAGFYFAFDSLRNGTAFMGGIPAFSFASVVGLAAAFDLSVIVRRGISGRQRIARHLWRMHLGLFAAVGSFFPGQLQFFPVFIQKVRPIILLFIPAFLVIGLMFFWLARVLFTNRFSKVDMPSNTSPG